MWPMRRVDREVSKPAIPLHFPGTVSEVGPSIFSAKELDPMTCQARGEGRWVPREKDSSLIILGLPARLLNDS